MSEDKEMSIDDLDAKVSRIDDNVEVLIAALDDIIKQRQHINNLYDHWRAADVAITGHAERLNDLEAYTSKTKRQINLIHFITVSIILCAAVGSATHLLL